MTQFVYKSSINMSIDMSPFEVLHGYRPRKPLDFFPMSSHDKVYELLSLLHVEFKIYMFDH
jgi:hypothetical protein